MKKMTALLIAALVVLASAGSLLAHHSLAQFDTLTPVRVKGTVVMFAMINPHSVLFLDQKAADGKTQRWAVDGPPVAQLSRLGFEKTSFKVGDVIEACGYILKNGVESQRTISTEPISLSLKDSKSQYMSGKVMDGELLVMPGGEKRPWSDYGHHLCLGTDFPDRHTK